MPDWPQSPAVARLFQRADQWFQQGRAAVHDQLPCRQGCSHCCHGTFAVTVLDHMHIQRGMALLPPVTREEIATRARAQTSSMETAFPRLTRSGYIDDWADEELDHLVTRFSYLPCPALDQNGSCLIYAHRPMTCRMMGLPVEREGLVEGACDVQTLGTLDSNFRHRETRGNRTCEKRSRAHRRMANERRPNWRRALTALRVYR